MTRSLLAALTLALALPATADSPLIVFDQEASGVKPGVQDTVVVHYTGRLTNGTVFDSSLPRNEPAAFQLYTVIPCWTQTLTQMSPGSRATITCPPELAYGHAGVPGIVPPDSTLIFDVELFEVVPFVAPD